jgi:hypothetical protein
MHDILPFVMAAVDNSCVVVQLVELDYLLGSMMHLLDRNMVGKQFD